MDLFEDLPEPASRTLQEVNVESSGVDLFSNASNAGEGLFDDLPSSKIPGEERAKGEKRKSTEEDSQQKNVRLKSCAKYSLKSFVADRKGEREEMQDAHFMLHNYHQEIPDLHPSIYRLSLFGVFDGHGGGRASRLACQVFPRNLRDRFPKGDVSQVERDIKKCFIEAFKKTDEDFLKQATKNKPTWKDGTTAILVLVINETLFIANLGDSKSILCRYKEDQAKCVAVPLSTDHSPGVYEERMRIQKSGGHVREGRVMGQLEVSRSIGDGPYKNHGVICLPDVKRCQLTDHDRFLLLACDGLWKSFSLQESVDLVNNIVNSQPKGEDKKTSADTLYEAACNKLANDAVLRFSGDNVTVAIVSITRSQHAGS
ncbi:integrin-linked kinase-associated serine/threonine phosphatase 2C-like [Haliotis cracherodii]|uniref:integrin-linked kinase-associated serine/threonine phosphatase 2C-like n=1 Tax=Haliotis cracherodii TaxID=6455 RepID=UPI001EAFED71